MWETIRGYLTFTRKERYGVLFLLILITILFVFPYVFKPSAGDPDPAAYAKMKEGILKFESRSTDSSREAYKYDRDQNRETYLMAGNPGKTGGGSHAEMFYFDPNKIQAADWSRLGLTERLTQTILHYLEKGGRFQKAEDLKKLYGLHNTDYERLSPYVRIAKTAVEFKAHSDYYTKSAYNIATEKKTDSFFRESPFNPVPDFGRRTKKFVITDINLTDSSGWSMLPGIGSKLASRIIHYREKLGGFFQPDQVGETFGLPDSTFQKMKPYLRLNAVSLNKIDLNTATKEMLQSHPYIRWQLAKGIIEYRLRHGIFQSADELLQLAQMDQAKFEKLKPYLIASH
jgi:competence protein ComEA